MSDGAIDRARREFLDENKIFSQADLETLRRSSPKNENERRGRKRSPDNYHEIHTTHAQATNQSLVVMDDADHEPAIEQPESGQRLIKQFFELFVSGEIEHRLDGLTPAAQAHLINEIKAGIPLLEEFVAKNKTVEVIPFH